MTTFGFCIYHEIECDYEGLCIECPHNTKEDAEWFEKENEKEEEHGRTDKRHEEADSML